MKEFAYATLSNCVTRRTGVKEDFLYDQYKILLPTFISKNIIHDWERVDISVSKDKRYIIISKGGRLKISRTTSKGIASISATALVNRAGLLHGALFDGSRFRVKKTKDGKLVICLEERIERND